MKKIILAALGLFVVMTLFASSGVGAATAGDDCTNCHGTVVSDLMVASPTLGETCTVCHGVITARHSSPAWTAVYVDGVGYFKSADSVLTGPPSIHSYHSGMNTPAGSDACARCHRAASCETCHTPVNHKLHGSTEMEIYPSYIVATGISYGSLDISCSTSSCHRFYSPGIVPSGPNDTTNLCFNCHSTDKAGHDDTQLAALHTTTFPSELMFTGQLTGIYPVDCLGCHNSTLDVEHANQDKDCMACHKSTNAAVINVIDIAGNIEANRSCDKCHFNAGVIPVPEEHPLFHIATESNNLRIDGAPHESCNTCHQRQEILPDIAALAGSSEKNYSCYDCHNGDGTTGSNPKAPVHSADYSGQQMAVMDVHTSCADCHTPGTTYAAVIDTIIADGRSDSYSCTECHTDLSSGHQAAFEGVQYEDTTAFHLKCTDCHNETYKSVITGLKEDVKDGNGYDCSACHLENNDQGMSPYYPVHQADGEQIPGYHPLSCETCHGVVDGQYRIDIDPIRDNVPVPGYSCSACHGDIATMHQSTTDLSMTDLIAADKPVDCSWCHTSTNETYAFNNLIGVHVEPNITLNQEYTCGVCHDPDAPVGDQINTGLTACEACHNDVSAPAKHPETQYAPEHEVDLFPVFMPEYSPDCSTCHAESLIDIHSAISVGCGACHTDERFKPAVVGLDVSCEGCHDASVNAEMDMAETHKPFHDADTALYPDTAFCLNCHQTDDLAAGQNLLAVHKKRSSSTVTCDSCHGTTARDSVKEAIAAGDVSCQACHGEGDHTHNVVVYEEPEEVNCAACHAADSASGDTELAELHNAYDKDCAACHTEPFYGEVIARDGELDMLANGSTSIYCSNCHNGDTANGYPVTRDAAHLPEHRAVQDIEQENLDCSVCHTFNITAGTEYVFTGQGSAVHEGGCNTCHGNTGIQEIINPMVGESNAYNCTLCHNGSDAKTHLKLHQVVNSEGCINCHGNGANDVVLAHNGNCATCHTASPAIAITTAVIEQNLSSNTTVKEYSCTSCHQSVSHQRGGEGSGSQKRNGR